MAIDKALFRRALGGFVFLIIAMGAVIFGSAGTFAYPQAWAMLATFGLATAWITLDLARRDPALLARRSMGGPGVEPEPRQKVIQTLAAGAFLALMIAPALEKRFGAPQVAWPVSLAADGVILGSYWAINRVFAANSHAAATVRVEADQQLIDTGPYRLVRHPMYAAALPMVFAMPVALGSLWSAVFGLAMLPVLAWRAIEEERLLRAELTGYDDYCRRVRFRLIPGVL